MGFNPEEKRGPDGKWTLGGAIKKAVGKVDSNHHDRASERASSVLKKASGGETTLRRQAAAITKKNTEARAKRLENPDRF